MHTPGYEATKKVFFTSLFLKTVDFRYRRTLSAGTTAASGLQDID